MATEFPALGPIRPPRSFTKGRKAGQPTIIVIHTTEGSEGRASAENGAAYDARRTDGTSTHFFVDQDSVVQCVATTDEAHAARAHGNDVGVQIEVCGKAGQTVAQWDDEASRGTVEQAAYVCVLLRRKYPNRFPLVNLIPAQVRAGQHGFAEHRDFTQAWPEDRGSHTDPGPNFPWPRLFAAIRRMEGITPPIRPILKRGAKGAAVKELQRALHITADGDFGPKTEAAVKAFQRAHKLTADGIVGPKTWAKLA